MGCGSCGEAMKKKKAVYKCASCGKEEELEMKTGQVLKNCCGKPMKKK